MPIRRALASLLALTLVLLVIAGAEPARAQSTGYGTIAVDVGPLRAKGLGPYAEVVRGTLQGALAGAFADRIVRGGPKLVVRVDSVSMRDYVGGEGRTRFGGGGLQNDYMEGEALVVGRGGAVLLRHPQLSALPSSSGGAWYLPDNDARRLAALSEHFAGWLRRGLD